MGDAVAVTFLLFCANYPLSEVPRGLNITAHMTFLCAVQKNYWSGSGFLEGRNRKGGWSNRIWHTESSPGFFWYLRGLQERTSNSYGHKIIEDEESINLDGLWKVQYLRYAASFVTATYCKYASFLRILQALILNIFRNRLNSDALRFRQILRFQLIGNL